MFTKKDILSVCSCVPPIFNCDVDKWNNEELIQKPDDCLVRRILLFLWLFFWWVDSMQVKRFRFWFGYQLSIKAIFICVAPITFQLRLIFFFSQSPVFDCLHFSRAVAFAPVNDKWSVQAMHCTACIVNTTNNENIFKNIIPFNCTFSYRIWF